MRNNGILPNCFANRALAGPLLDKIATADGAHCFGPTNGTQFREDALDANHNIWTRGYSHQLLAESAISWGWHMRRSRRGSPDTDVEDATDISDGDKVRQQLRLSWPLLSLLSLSSPLSARPY